MTGNYLIYTKEAEAWAKAEEEGRSECPDGWSGDNVTQYITVPEMTNANTYALEVTDYETLTMDEIENIVNEVLFRWEINTIIKI